MNLRNKLIREVLDSDMNINKKLSSIQKKKLAYNPEDAVHPYLQINDDDIDKMKKSTALLRQILEKKRLIATQYSEHITNNTEAGRYIIELSQTEDVLMAYNDVVRLYLNPRNTQETKSHISRIIVSFEDMISDIVQIINSIVKHLYDNKKLLHFNQLVYALTLYQIIQEQLSKNRFYIIYVNDIKHDYEIRIKEKHLQR